MSDQPTTTPATVAAAPKATTKAVVMAYRFRLEPTPNQERRLRQFAGARRWSYNWALARRREYYTSTGKTLSFAALCAELTALKAQPDTAWLRMIDSQLVQQGLKDLCAAFVNFFEGRARYPTFRKKHKQPPTFRIPQRIGLPGHGLVTIPGVGTVKMRQSREIVGAVKSATVKHMCGHWSVTLVAHQEIEDRPKVMLTEANTIGIDLGLKDALVTSEGERVPALRAYRATQKRRRKAVQGVARRKGARKCETPSNRFKKAKARAAKIDHKAANQRADFLHKLSTALVRAHEGIMIEDLAVKGLAKTTLATSVYDAGMGMFRWMLEYKAERAGKTVVVIDRWFPSSQVSSTPGCGYRNTKLTLSDREWTCPRCAVTHDRDINAARNIKAEGLRVYRIREQVRAPLEISDVAAGQAETENARGRTPRPPMGGRPG